MSVAPGSPQHSQGSRASSAASSSPESRDVSVVASLRGVSQSTAGSKAGSKAGSGATSNAASKMHSGATSQGHSRSSSRPLSPKDVKPLPKSRKTAPKELEPEPEKPAKKIKSRKAWEREQRERMHQDTGTLKTSTCVLTYKHRRMCLHSVQSSLARLICEVVLCVCT